MPPTPSTERVQVLFVDQERALADFVRDSVTGWYQSPPPQRLLMALDAGSRPEDLRLGIRLVAHLGWQVVQGKRWRFVRVLRLLAPDPGDEPQSADDPPTAAEPTAFSTLLARAPRADRPGGARGAVGRKALVEDDATEAHSITLPASAWRLLARLGAGNRSEGVRRLMEEYQVVVAAGSG